MTKPSAVTEWHGVDPVSFEQDIVPGQQPALLRGLVHDWPLVGLAGQSDEAVAAWLSAQDSGADVDAVMVPPPERGRIFFSADGAGFNFLRNRLPLSRVVEQVLRYRAFDNPPAVAVQSALVADCLPGFAGSHPMPLLERAAPRLWFGNTIVTPTHFDESSNLACVVAGRRRFTLFPPEQIANLYIGPIGHAPTGTPISLVDLGQPDLVRYPRFAQALAHSRQALLGPGDALYIPPLWWHHVVSLSRLNLMINYWWSRPGTPSGLGAVLHAMLALREFPPPQRQAWRALFEHWVFDADASTVAHLTAQLQGVHAPLTAARADELRRLVLEQLGRPEA